MGDPGEIERFYDRCSNLMRELLNALADAPDRPRPFGQIEDTIRWPRRRIASVLGGVHHLRHTEFGGRRPYRFHDPRQSESGRWEMWMDGIQAGAVLAAQRINAMDSEQLFRSLYASFNAQDLDAVLAATCEDVNWPNAWEGGRIRGRQAVRDYWHRQWSVITPHVEPSAITTRPDGLVAVRVQQVVRTREGDVLSENELIHVYEMRGGLIARMTVEDA